MRPTDFPSVFSGLDFSRHKFETDDRRHIVVIMAEAGLADWESRRNSSTNTLKVEERSRLDIGLDSIPACHEEMLEVPQTCPRVSAPGPDSADGAFNSMEVCSEPALFPFPAVPALTSLRGLACVAFSPCLLKDGVYQAARLPGCKEALDVGLVSVRARDQTPSDTREAAVVIRRACFPFPLWLMCCGYVVSTAAERNSKRTTCQGRESLRVSLLGPDKIDEVTT